MVPRLVVSVTLSLAAATLSAGAQDVHVHVSPASHGTTSSTDDFPTIQMAMDHASEPGPAPGKDGHPARLYLHIGPGTYQERVIVTQNRPNTTFLGEGPDASAVVITAGMNARSAGGTFFTETVRVDAPGFEADNLTFENSAGDAGGGDTRVPGELARGGGGSGQAVALANRSDRSVIKHCRILGHQDTLFADFGRQYYLDDLIEGTVDFIFGNAAAAFDRSEIRELSGGYLTAQSRTSPRQATGYVILHSRVTSSLGDDVSGGGESARRNRPPERFFLGRPWRAYARTVFLYTELPATLSPEGWSKWKGNNNERTAFYGEFGNTGPGAALAGRASWSHQLTATEVRQFLPQNFLAGPETGAERWDPISEAERLP